MLRNLISGLCLLIVVISSTEAAEFTPLKYLSKKPFLCSGFNCQIRSSKPSGQQQQNKKTAVLYKELEKAGECISNTREIIR